MKSLENIKLRVNPDLHDKLPTKWKKIGNVLIIGLENLAEDKKREIAEIYARELNAKTVIQKSKVSGELRKPEKAVAPVEGRTGTGVSRSENIIYC